MNRRHTFSNVVSDYPEHLNPFREENGLTIIGDNAKENNQVNGVGLGRRNSRLSASFRVKNWAMFSKKSKNSETYTDEQSAEAKPAASRGKFSTLTPRLSRHIIDVLTPKKSKEKVAVQEYYHTLPTKKRETATATTTPPAEFTLIKPNRERFAPRVTEVAEGDEPVKPVAAEGGEPRGSRVAPVPEPRLATMPPVPLPRTTVARATSAPSIEQSPDQGIATTSTYCAENAVEEESKYVRQGARPKKKRQAPMPPSALPAPQINHTKQDTTPSGPSLQPDASNSTTTAPNASDESKPIALAVEEIDFSVKLYIDDDL